MYISQTYSTNTLLRDDYPDAPHLFTIRTDYQTAGRGQAGNGWESEAGKNLLFSTLIRPDNMPATEQFSLSMAVSIALRRTVASLLAPGEEEVLTVKWPNDLYYGDKKLAGILIENIIQGANICRSIAGIGLNVNQLAFTAAPNPISLALITGRTFDPEEILNLFLAELPRVLAMPSDELQTAYLTHLYRRKGFYPYQEREVSILPTNNISPEQAQAERKLVFMAEIAGITAFGELILRDSEGQEHTYHYKQIRYVL